MSISLRQVLNDFGPAPTAKGALLPDLRVDAPPETDPGGDMDRRLADAFARGEEQGRAAALAELRQELADQRAALESQVAAERQRWTEEQGRALAAAINEAMAELEARLGEAVAGLLDPFLRKEVRDRMAASLTETVRCLLSGRDGAALTVQGPPDLLDALEAALGSAGAAVEYQPAEQVDVRVRAGDTVVETAIGGWFARFDEVAG